MMKKILIVILLIMILIFSACKKEAVVIADRTFALDTLVDLKIYHYENEQISEQTIKRSFELINMLENTLSIHVDSSDIAKLKQLAGSNSVHVSDDTYALLKQSLVYSDLTDGLFDITSGPLIDLWAIDPPEGHVPSEKELEKALALINYEKIKLLDDNHVMLEDEGMIVNLGAIAKGYIADRVKDSLLADEVEHALINLGGNVLLVGDKLDGSDFRIGIQNPYDGRGAYLMSIQIVDQALVSSGDYERFFEYEGEIYHHILNPKTGYPAKTNIKQVTIVAPNSTIADGLSTSILLVGLKKGIDIIEHEEGVDAVFITKDKKIYITEGLEGKYELDDEQMKGYTLVESPQALY